MSREFMEELLNSIFDVLEEYTTNMVIVAGKKIVYVFYVTIGFLLIAITCKFTNSPSFLSIPEALIAVIFMGCVCCINRVNKASINKVKSLLLKNNKRKEEVYEKRG